MESDEIADKSPPVLGMFSAAEALALFPTPPPVEPELGIPAPADPAGAAREHAPLSRRALLAELPQPLRGLARLQFAFVGRGTSFVPRLAILALLEWPLLAVTYVGRGSLFSAQAMLASMLSTGLCSLAVVAGGIASAGYLHGFRKPLVGAQVGLDADAAGHPLAVFARWKSLVRKGSSGLDAPLPGADSEADPEADRAGLASKLLAHDPADKLCPCSRNSCAGGLMRSAGRLRLLELPLRILLPVASFWLVASTATITLAPWTWSIWWAGLITAAWLAYTADFFTGLAIYRTSGSISASKLTMRLHHRAMSLLLMDMLEKPQTPPTPRSRQPYVDFHLSLVAVWEKRSPVLQSGSMAVVMYLATVCIVSITNIIAGACVPLWVVILLAFTLFILMTDLINIAASNSEISAISDLCLRARTACLVAAGGDPSSPLRYHAEVLAAFAAAERHRARFAGFPVGVAVVRTVLVTSITVLAAVWSLLRTSGVAIVLDVACPSP